MDFERRQFEKDMKDFSEGQKKKVLIAASLCEPAHLYVWDEPFNFIDVYSRMQIEELIKKFSAGYAFGGTRSGFSENLYQRRLSGFKKSANLKEMQEAAQLLEEEKNDRKNRILPGRRLYGKAGSGCVKPGAFETSPGGGG